MKKFTLRSVVFMLLACTAVFQGCLKDTASRTYTMFVPVYKTVAEVRSAIKNDVAMPVRNPGKLFVLGNYIFLNEIDKGIHVIDNTDPSAPVNKYFIAIPGNLDLAVKGNILYADLYRDLVTIDISNPAAIQVKKISEGVFPARTYSTWFVADPNRVIVDWIKKDTTVTAIGNEQLMLQDSRGAVFLTAQFSSSTKATSPGVGGSMARFTLVNNYLYTVGNTDLNVFNISEPANPAFITTVNAGWRIETIYPFKNKLFMGARSGMFIVNIDNPALPVLQSQFTHATACDPVIAEGDYAYVTLHAGTACEGTLNELEIINVQNVESAYRVNSYTLTSPQGLSKSGNTLFVCDGIAGVKIFDATDVNNLKLIKTVDGIDAYDIIAQNNNAIVVGKDGLYQYDYSNLNNVKLRSKLTVSRYN